MIKSNDIEIHWNKQKRKFTRHINILLQIKVYEGFSHIETGIEICVAPSSRKCKNVTPNIAWYAIRMQLDSRWDVRLTVQMNYIHIELELYFHFSKFILFTTQTIYTINPYLKQIIQYWFFLFLGMISTRTRNITPSPSTLWHSMWNKPAIIHSAMLFMIS